jgi:hypothetical protein
MNYLIKDLFEYSNKLDEHVIDKFTKFNTSLEDKFIFSEFLVSVLAIPILIILLIYLILKFVTFSVMAIFKSFND